MTIKRAGLVALILAGGLALSGAASAASAASAAPAQTPVVQTRSGPVQGVVRDGTRQFLGLPFAKPPVGPLRWRPPEAPAPWAAVRQATSFGGSCPQGRDLGDFAKPSQTEDCLYLNVYAPTAPSKAPRAVMLWFPGGALFAGAADDYDGAKLARRGDVVVVTMNYRLGVLGFFAHPAIDAEGHLNGNYGIQDQQAALRWIRDNIARFGGDPKNVTVFGQSAGATSVRAHLLSGDSAGLFHRAIDQSGSRPSIPTETAARTTGTRFAAAAGCADQSAACLRALDVKTIVQKQVGNFVGLLVDGRTVVDQPYLAFRMGAFNHVPILTGLVSDEQAFFLAISQETTAGGAALTPAGYRAWLNTTFGANADAVLKVHPAGGKASPSLDVVAASEGQRACSMRSFAGWMAPWAPTYAYEFDDKTAPSYLKPQPYPMGAYHTAELVYLFPGFHGGPGTPHALSPAQDRLSDKLIDSWAAFARTGNPNLAGSTAWPRYDAKADNVQSLDIPGFQTITGFGQRYSCETYDKIAGF